MPQKIHAIYVLSPQISYDTMEQARTFDTLVLFVPYNEPYLFAEAREREALHINLIFPHRNEQTAEISLVFFLFDQKTFALFCNSFANTFAESTGFLVRITLLNFL